MTAGRWRRVARASGLVKPGSAAAPRPLADEAGAEVAAHLQRHGECHATRRGHDRQHEHPPALVGEGAYCLCPADGREPRQAAVADIADGAQHERDGDERRGEADGRTSAGGDLRCDRGDGGEHGAGAEQCAGERDRAGEGQVARHERDDDADVDDCVCCQRAGESGRQLRMPTDRRRADQLRTLALLLGPCVPNHHEHAHQGDGDDGPDAGLVHHHRSERRLVEAVTRPRLHDQRGVVLHQRAVLQELGGGAVEPVDALGAHDQQPDDAHHPAQHSYPVAARDQAGELTEPGERCRTGGSGARHDRSAAAAASTSGARSSP